MDSLELMSGDHFHVILHPDQEHGLIFNRLDGTVTTIYYNDAKELSNIKPMSRIYGIVGRFLDRYLVLIRNRSKVGSLYEPNSKKEHEVFVITQVQVIDISHVSTATSTSTKACSTRTDFVKYDVNSARNENEDSFRELKNNEDFSSLPITISTNSYNSAQSRATNWNPFKLANPLRPIMPAQFLKSSLTDQSANQSCSASSQSTSSQQDDADRRLVEEMMKLFNNTNSFYYSPTLDLTRRFSCKNLIRTVGNEAVWKTADERFFWNKYMLKDLIELSKEDSDANYFICVILQGFVAIEQHSTSLTPFEDSGVENGISATSMNFIRFNSGNNNHCDKDYSSTDDGYSIKDRFKSKTYQLALVSRRSVFQAGTRYRRRGCDEEGNCANFVETEQIFRCNQHFTSLVLVRGSIPLFWYQTGYNYRPPPVLIRSEEENHRAFTRHFENLFHSYGTERIISVDCTEQTGREKILHDAYKKHMDRLNEIYPQIKLIEFDFHKHCRGRQCTDLQIERHLRECGLTDQLLKDVKYYWNDNDVVWNQEGLFRINCLDCSDRTNVVQRAIALKILDLQLARLGIIAPDTCPDDNECRKIMQLMWSTNGNVLSTQYCGTRALFGGDRKLSGYLKDTYSSASRYYISKFRDVYRQAAIDAMLGVESVDSNNLKSESFKDQYELLSFDPILAGRSGSALLKDVGNRFSNRLARLKGKFYVRPFGHDHSDVARMRQNTALETTPEILETGLIETLGDMSIDWPSSESVENNNSSENSHTQVAHDVFDRFANCDDSFQDDEFGQLMLSIDLAELQRLREEDEEDTDIANGLQKDRKPSEQIDMAETGRVKVDSKGTNQVNTTST